MIKLPKDVKAVMQKLDEKGFRTYAAGSCVLEALAGEVPYYWTLLAEGKGDGDSPQVVVEEELKQIKERGEMELFIAAAQTGESWLMKQPFTLYAIAGHPERGFLDPLNGREDLKKRLVRAACDPDLLFGEKPEMILEALCLAAELDLDVELGTYKAMQTHGKRLLASPAVVIRDQFSRILTGKAAAKALRMASGCGALTALLGEGSYPPQGRHEAQQLETLMENLDLSKEDAEYRFALLFLCFEKKQALEMIGRLTFDQEFERLMKAAVELMEDLYFASDKHRFKPFLAKVGRETYEYLHALSKQQRKVYDLPEYRIRSRIYMLKEYEDFKQPVFVEDLAVTAADLAEVGITEPEEAERMLMMLVDVVHKHPGKNTRPILLKSAADFRKNPLKAALRGVRWVK